MTMPTGRVRLAVITLIVGAALVAPTIAVSTPLASAAEATVLPLAPPVVGPAQAATSEHSGRASRPTRVRDQPPDTFSIRNLTDRPLIVTGVRVQGNRVWSAAFGAAFPYPGQVIQSGQVAYTNLTFFYNGPGGDLKDNKAWIDYTIGVEGPVVHAMVYNNGWGWPGHQTAYTCDSADAAWTCAVDGDGHGADLYLTAKTDTVVPASDSATQARLMQALCQPGNNAVHCDFAAPPKTLDHVTIPFAAVGDSQYNYTDDDGEHSWTQEWEMGTLFEIGGSFSPLDIDVEKVVKVEVKATFKHEWGTSHSLSVTNSVDVEPGRVGWIEAEIPALQVTGDLRVGIGNQWWTLQGATFTAPDADADGGFGWSERGRTRPMTDAEKAAKPATP